VKQQSRLKKKDGSRAQILKLLREHDSTVRDLADRLGLTRNAVRAHLETLQEEGLVRRGGHQSGTRKPHVIYALTENATHAFPNAYGLLLRAVVDLLVSRLPPREVKNYLRDVGRQLASESARRAAGKAPRERRRLALKMLEFLGGEASLSTNNGTELIEGKSCPLSVITASHPEACLIAQTLLSEIIGQPVQEHCHHGSHPRCRFQISP